MAAAGERRVAWGLLHGNSQGKRENEKRQQVRIGFELALKERGRDNYIKKERWGGLPLLGFEKN